MMNDETTNRWKTKARNLYAKFFINLEIMKFDYRRKKNTMRHNLKLEPGQKLFVTSDSHFSHLNILTLCNRPFKDEVEMGEEMIKRWNNVVGPNDIVVHLGDFTMRRNADYILKLLSRLNGKIILVWGNHDHKESWGEVLTRIEPNKILFTCDILEMNVNYGAGRTDVVFCHFPIASWNHKERGTLHLFGHCHGNYNDKADPRSLDVGVDSIRNADPLKDFAPIEISKAIQLIRTKEVL
jgi:calcineurin-like phosphoesterase family protein